MEFRDCPLVHLSSTLDTPIGRTQSRAPLCLFFTAPNSVIGASGLGSRHVLLNRKMYYKDTHPVSSPPLILPWENESVTSLFGTARESESQWQFIEGLYVGGAPGV